KPLARAGGRLCQHAGHHGEISLRKDAGRLRTAQCFEMLFSRIGKLLRNDKKRVRPLAELRFSPDSPARKPRRKENSMVTIYFPCNPRKTLKLMDFSAGRRRGHMPWQRGWKIKDFYCSCTMAVAFQLCSA